MRTREAWRRAAVLAAATGVGLACAPSVPVNLLADPGFEQGGAPWGLRTDGARWEHFEIVGAPVRSGARAALLPLRHDGAHRQPVQVRALVQQLVPARFPERVAGWYRADHWEKSSEAGALYLQVVVIVLDDPRTPRLVDPAQPDPRVRNYQLRYLLAGEEEPPYEISNARMIVVSGEPPPPGAWVHFDLPVRDDFERLWGVVPEGFARLDVLFEARWDALPDGARVRGDVYYDDLFVGDGDPEPGGGDRGGST